MKTGILLVAFGAGNPQSAATLKKVQGKVELRTGLPVRWAFTSETMRKRLAHARTKSDSVLKALLRMGFERYTHVAVQSLHLLPGLEYHDVLEDIARAVEQTELHIRAGKSLLMDKEAVPSLADALFEHLPERRTPRDAVVCMAHGSLHESRELYGHLAECVAARDPLVHVACMKGAPGLEQVLPLLGGQVPDRVWLLPLLSVTGKHSREDMAGDKPTSWKRRLTEAGFQCMPDLRGLADGPRFVELWMNRLDEALNAVQSV